MDGGEQTTISPEFLENIQSAVNSQGVLGQVQVIETENGPVTVLFMEEGADTSNLGGENITLSVDGNSQGLSETVIGDENTEVQYQYHVQTEDDYSQLLQGAVGDTIVSVADTVPPVKEDLAVEPVIDLPQVAPAVQSTVTETFQQPEGDTSTDTYYITDTGEILKIDSSLLGENAGDATLQLQTQDGTLQILNQIGNIQTTEANTSLTTFSQPSVDTGGNINITYEQSTPSFEYTATKVDSQGITEVTRAEEPKVLSYKTTNRQRTNIMRQPVSKPTQANIQPKPAAASQTSLLHSQFSTLKQADASLQTPEIIYPKPYQKKTIVFPKVQKQTVHTNVLKSGQQSYQVKTNPQKMITTVVKPQSLLKSNASNFTTSTSIVNKSGFTQIPVTTKSFATSTFTQKQVPVVNKIQSQAIGTRVPTVTKQQTDLLSVAMKQAEVSHQILPPVPEVKKVVTPAIVKEPALSIQKTEISADHVSVVKNVEEQLESAKENIEVSVPTTNDSITEKTSVTEELETVPMDTSQEKIDTPLVSNVETQSDMSSESKMEIDEQPAEYKLPVDDNTVEEVLTGGETEKPGPDSSSKQVSINRFSEKYLQEKNNVKKEKGKTGNLRDSNVKKALKVSSFTQTTNVGSENDANSDGSKHVKKNKFKVLHSSRLKHVKIPSPEMSKKNREGNGKSKIKEKDRIVTKKAHNLPIKKVLKCELCSFMTEKKSNLKQHMFEKHKKVAIPKLKINNTPEPPKLDKSLLKTRDKILLKTQDKNLLKTLSERTYYFKLNKRNVKCKLCKKVISKGSFNEHLDKMHESDKFSCGKCKKTFISEVDRLDHVIEGSCKLDCEYADKVKSDKEASIITCETGSYGDTDNFDDRVKSLDVGLESANVKDKLKDDFNESIEDNKQISKFTSSLKSNCLRHLKVHLASKGYKCFKCERPFTSLREKIFHVRHGHSRNLYRCQHCAGSFASKRAYLLHTNLHQGIYPFRCSLCRFGFIRENILERHFQKCGSAAEVRYLSLVESYRDKVRRSKKRKLPAHHRCHTCNKSFMSFGKLTLHKQIVHYGLQKPTVPTSVAGFTKDDISKSKRFSLAFKENKTQTISSTNVKTVDVRVIKDEDPDGPEKIVKTKSPNKEYDVKGKALKGKTENRECKVFELNREKNTAVELNDDEIVGPLLNEVPLPFEQNPMNMLDTCSIDTGNGTMVDQLGAVQINIPDLQFEEYRGVVPEGLHSCRPLVKPYQCEDCNVLCVGELHFKRHMQTLHSEGLQCKICKKKSTKQDILVAHMIDKHLIGKPLTCPKCDKAFKKINTYWRHAELHVERFSCEICDRRFARKCELTRHLNGHVEVKEFCVRCGELFDTHDLLRIHNWKEHGVRMNKRKIPLFIRKQRRELMKQEKKVQLTLDLSIKNEESAEKDVGKQVEETKRVTSSKQYDGQAAQSSANISSNTKSIDVPDSDVTIQLFADGTLVTRDKAGTNYSQVKLEDLGLDLSMLEGNTDIELLIVQGDGKEVRATINTSQHVNPTTESLSLANKSTSATTVASALTGTKLTASSASTERPAVAVNEARPYKCSMCPRTFKFYRTFRCHEIVHTKAVTFTCHLCQRLFAREVNLQSHLELHKKKGAMRPTEEQKRRVDDTHKCQQCQKLFSSANALQRHIKDQHEKHPRVPCPICGKLFKNETNVQRHSKIHVGPFTCPHCVKVFTDRTEYYEHIKSEHEDLMYPCKECNAILPSKRAFLNHIKTQHNNSDELMDGIKGNECTICNKKFERESDLEVHMVVHSSTKSHECPACNKKYKLLNTLEKHIKEVHNNDVVFTCSECDEKFDYKGKLDLHVKLFHTGSYQCLTCYENFPERTLLEEHQHKDHDFALVCSKCNSKFDTSLKLKNHLKEHISQNNLCDICGAGFEHKAQLRSHLVNKHFGREKTSMLKQYPSMGSVNIEIVCDLCGEFWHNKPLYKQHLRDVHFGGDTVEMLKLFPTFEKIPDPPEPVTCDHCGKKCLSMVQLNFHLKTHVKSKRKSVQTEEFSSSDDEHEDPYDFTNIEPRDLDKDYKCKKCDAQFARKAALEKHMSVHKKDEFKEALKNIEKEETARAELEEQEGYKPSPKVKKVGKESLNKTFKIGKAGKIKLPFPKTKLESPPSPDTTPSKRKASQMHICNTCEEIFKTSEELTDHMHNDHGELYYVVERKNPSTETKKVLEFDLEAFHCKSCNKTFSCRKNLRKHLRGVHKYLEKTSNASELYKCTECEREFTMKSNMARHMMAKHEIGIDEGQGESPSKTRKKLGEISEGSDDSNESMDEASKTDITSFLGKNFNLGKTHSCNIQSVKKKQHKCNLCGEGFSRDATLKKHMAFHETEDDVDGSKPDIDDLSDLQPAIYTCFSCGNKYSTALGLIHHTRVKHSEVDEETVLAHIAEVDTQLKLESPKKKLEKESNKVNNKRKLEFDAEETHENAKKRRKVDKDDKEVYNCKFCGMIYYTFKGVIKHERDVHKDKMESPQSIKYSHSGRMITKSKKLSEQIHCDKCNKTFLEEKGLKQHILRVHKEEDTRKVKVIEENGKFKCDLCPKEFDQRINLRRHMKMKHNIELSADTMNTSLSESPLANLLYNCDVCIQKFSTLSNLRIHMVSAHDENDEEIKSENEMHVCKICDGEFATEKALEVHMRKHTGEKPYKCCLCNKHFISKFQLECHIRKLHPKQWAKNVKCKICLMLFETQKAMLKHKLTHRKPLDSEEQKVSKGEPSQHKCSHCEKMFRWKRNLLSHVEAYHTESDPLTCGVCNKVFPDKESIKTHMTVHNKPKREIPTCKICDKTFKKQSSLKMHVAQLHKEKPTPKGSMSCDICKESFATKMKLLEHMLSHTSVMPHKCDICSASFHLETKLKAHKLSHTSKEKKSEGKNIVDKSKKKSDEGNNIDKKKESRFSCKKCSKKFRDILLLKAHVTKVHKKKLAIKTPLPKDRITRSRSLSETKVNPSKIASTKEKKQLKERKGVKSEIKKAQSSFCKKCNLNFIKKETYENHMKTVHDNGNQAKKSDLNKKGDQGKNTEKKILKKNTGNADRSKKPEKLSAKKNTEEKKDSNKGNADKLKKPEKLSTKKKDTVGFDCPICKKIFSKRFKLKTHIKNVHRVSIEDSPYDNKRTKCLFCKHCARVFWSQKQYETHNKKFHPDMNALELDKQVMQAMGEGDIKTEPSDLAPKDTEFETIQHKCEFCSIVHWTKKLFDEHIMSKHPEHAAEYGITCEEDTSRPTIEFVNDSEDMMGNLLSVGLYDASACNKLSSLPVVSIQRINGKLDAMGSASKKAKTNDADESSSDAESDADEYTREYKRFLQNSVIDVSENTEETETEDDKIDELGSDKYVEENKTENRNRDEPVSDDIEENKTGDKPVNEENIADLITRKGNTEIADMENDQNDNGDTNLNIDEVEQSEMEEEVKAQVDSNELSIEMTDSGLLNEEYSSVSNCLQYEPEKSAEQDVINNEQSPKNDAVPISYIDNVSMDKPSKEDEQSEQLEVKVISADNEKDDKGGSEIEEKVLSADIEKPEEEESEIEEHIFSTYIEKEDKEESEIEGKNFSTDIDKDDKEESEHEGKIFSTDIEKDDKEGSEIDREQERIDWEAIDNDIEAAFKDENDEDLSDEVGEEKDSMDDMNKDDKLETKQEILISNQEPENERVNDFEAERGEVKSDNIEGTNTDDISRKTAEEDKNEGVNDIRHYEIENDESSVMECGVSDEIGHVESSVAESGISDLIENKENDELFDSSGNMMRDEIQSKDTRTEEESIHFESQDAVEEMDTS